VCGVCVCCKVESSLTVWCACVCVAAAGVPLTKGDIDSRSNIVPAQIVDHER
jgi:hypothetical protein